MKIATWNVNSFKVRLAHVLDWLGSEQPDVLCLQELKCENSGFPLAALNEVGYKAAFNGQKTYNGVAILARSELTDVQHDIPNFIDPQKRIIAATIDGVRVVSAYFPNGQAVGSEKFAYKLEWLHALTSWLASELKRYPKLVLAGDYNIAPEDLDVHPDWKDEIHVSKPERDAFAGLQTIGLTDAFRLFEQKERAFSWWDYRMNAFKRNLGLRIDHILLSAELKPLCTACEIDARPRQLERPSDHAPVWVSLALSR